MASNGRCPQCREPACAWPAWRDGYCRRHWLLHFGSPAELSSPKRDPIERDVPAWQWGLATLRRSERRAGKYIERDKNEFRFNPSLKQRV